MHRFCRRKLFFPVTLGDFVNTARALEEIVRKFCPNYTAKVFICDTGEVYEFSRLTIITSELEDYLVRRKECDLAELDDDVVDRVFKLEFVLRSPEPGNSLMVSLTWDIHDERQKLHIYTQQLGDGDGVISNTLMKGSFLWRVESGFQSASAFSRHYVRRWISSRRSS